MPLAYTDEERLTAGLEPVIEQEGEDGPLTYTDEEREPPGVEQAGQGVECTAAEAAPHAKRTRLTGRVTAKVKRNEHQSQQGGDPGKRHGRWGSTLFGTFILKIETLKL